MYGYDNGPVINRDLWELLLGEYEKARDVGVTIQLWRIPRQWNRVADRAAYLAAIERSACGQWADIVA